MPAPRTRRGRGGARAGAERARAARAAGRRGHETAAGYALAAQARRARPLLPRSGQGAFHITGCDAARVARRRLWSVRCAAVATLTAWLALVGVARATPTFDFSYLDGASGPRPTVTVDLAGPWQFRVVRACRARLWRSSTRRRPRATGRQSRCPAGGGSSRDLPTSQKASTGRIIRIPDIRVPQATKVVVGAVNHEATLTIQRINGQPRRVGANTTSFTPSAFDLTPFVTPGKRYRITVDVRDGMRLWIRRGSSRCPRRRAGLRASHREYSSLPSWRSVQRPISQTCSSAHRCHAWLSGSLRSGNRYRWAYPQDAELRRLDHQHRRGGHECCLLGPVSSPGVNTTEMTLEQGGSPLYGADNLPDPWANPIVQLVRKAFFANACRRSRLLASDQSGECRRRLARRCHRDSARAVGITDPGDRQ